MASQARTGIYLHPSLDSALRPAHNDVTHPIPVQAKDALTSVHMIRVMTVKLRVLGRV